MFKTLLRQHSRKLFSDLAEYKRKFEPTIFHQSNGNLLTSILATHDSDLFKKTLLSEDTTSIVQKLRSSATRSTQSLNLTSSPSRSNISAIQSIAEKSEESVGQTPLKPKTRFEILTENIEAIKEKIEDQEDIYRQLSSDKREQKTSMESEMKKLEQLKKEKKLKMQVAMLLDNPEESKEKLKQSLEVAMKRRENLNNKFEAHKQPLEAKLESFSCTNAVKLQKTEEKIESIKAVKRLIQEIQEDIKNKTQTQQQLQSELSQMKRVTERSAYTSRIVDIIKSIKKQNNDINDILKDTKMLQKSINTVEGQLQRQFTVTEDLIWNNVSFQPSNLNKKVKFFLFRLPKKTNIPRKLINYSSPFTQSSVSL